MSETTNTLQYGNVRGMSRPCYAQGDARLELSCGGEMLSVPALPPKVEVVRLGNSWNMTIPTGSAFTHVANMPTTRAELALYNGEPSNGCSYVIDAAWYLALTSITAASGATLIAQLVAVAALTDNAAVLINSPIGRSYGGRGLRALAVTTMVANKWVVLASGPTGAAASIGHGVHAEVRGGIILPPGYTLGLNVVVGTAVGTGLIGVAWHEVNLPLG